VPSTGGTGAPTTDAGRTGQGGGVAAPTVVEGPSTGTTAPTGPLPTSSAIPSRPNTRPLTVGILNTGSNAALAAGFGKKGSTATWEGSDEALIRYFNKHGGIAGRQIKAVAYTVEATSTSYSTEVQAACSRFTQDYKVDVVLTTVGTGSFESLESCLSKARIVNLEAFDQGSTDAATFAKYPTLFTVGSPNVDSAITATLRGLTGTGYLSKKNKIGLLVEACPYNIRAYERSYAPLIKKLGYSVSRRDLQCVNGAADLGSFAQQVSTAVLPFRSEGIDRVSFISDFESLGVLAFSDQAQSQGWKPGYALTSAAHTGAYQPQLSQPQLPQMVGVGNLPNVDLTSRGTPTGTVARCRSILASEGITGSAPADYSIMDTACDIWWLLEDGLIKSRGHTDDLALVPALNALGGAHRSASVLGGTTVYDAAHRDGWPLSAVYAYQAACTCFRYTTTPQRLAPP
jgi:ABC-type branched-subunit amino acid transport system substrate-binding protein